MSSFLLFFHQNKDSYPLHQVLHIFIKMQYLFYTFLMFFTDTNAPSAYSISIFHPNIHLFFHNGKSNLHIDDSITQKYIN